MCWERISDGETGDCVGADEIREFFERTKGAKYVFHNALKYDGPNLVKLVGVNLGVSNLIDTLVLSTLYSPSLAGGHSLGAWAERLGRKKGDFNEFNRFSEEMLIYCRLDVSILAELFVKLIRVLRKIEFSEKSIALQHRLTVIIDRQSRNGFYFDGPRAIDFYRQLRTREEELQDDIRRVFPAERVLVAERQMFRRDGSTTAIYGKDRERYILEEDHPQGVYRAFEDVDFSIGSPQQRTQKLLELGWEPEEFTPRTAKGGGGNPKPFEHGELSPSLERFLEDKDVPEVRLIAKWMAINGRANMVNNHIENWNPETGCIHGSLFVADTLRFKHSGPNTANIPGVRIGKDGKVLYGEDGYYTYEARDLWTARPGRVLVGTDAAGLELIMLAHYLNRPEFTKQVLEGDPHQYNADMVGISRPQAKTLLYGITYGAGPPKVAKMLGVPIKEGAKVRQQFLDRLGLADVIEEVKNEQAKGRIELIDGSRIACPSPHSALNYRLQGGGARVMGLATVLLEKYIREDGLDSMLVGSIHDEWQYDVDPRDAAEHAKLSVQAIRDAGETLNMNVPLDGKATEGLTWAMTH